MGSQQPQMGINRAKEMVLRHCPTVAMIHKNAASDGLYTKAAAERINEVVSRHGDVS